MPRPKTAPFWVDRIKELDANEPRMTHAEMRRRLEEVGRKEKRDDCPSDRTMRTIRARLKAPSFDEERRQYRYVYWPESFERGDLPWEASGAALELLRLFATDPPRPRSLASILNPPSDAGQEAVFRPSVRLARWFWRITLAAPDAGPHYRRWVAGWLAGAEVLRSGEKHNRQAAEAWLRYAPWRSTEARAAYKTALDEGRVPHRQLEGGALEMAEALAELEGGLSSGGGRLANDETGEVREIPGVEKKEDS